MVVNGISGANSDMRAGNSGGATQMDSVSKNIQKQIANAEKRLQDISSNEEMTIEEKMKKRQEIQKEIANLNQQLRQHQIEQRKEEQSKKSSSMDDMTAGTREVSAKNDSGLSQASMSAMISADSTMKQAKVQGGMAAQMKGKAGVLESEIKLDHARGAGTEAKEAELAELQAKAGKATAAQMSSLAAAGKVMKEAAKADQTAEVAGTEDDQSKKADTKAGEKTNDVKEGEGNISGDQVESEIVTVAEIPDAEMIHPSLYKPIDVRL